MPKRTFSIKVGTAPTLALPANPLRTAYSIYNKGGADVYAGAHDGITTDQGWPIPAGQMISDDDDKEDVYLVSAAAGVDVRIEEILKPPEAK